jgi:hypothetical protein
LHDDKKRRKMRKTVDTKHFEREHEYDVPSSSLGERGGLGGGSMMKKQKHYTATTKTTTKMMTSNNTPFSTLPCL